ncbi:DNA-binding MarR family transcriptional regulator [Paenibacillus phyllosphaerae]|uniref:DNA-binding MarR family transcriptional regulator n=1 Tax=Paenibacillus phyllosphaerae TaxID=274593 RepID=A0A7W5ATH9_9BACL|nr:MarR family transcriptional regulator [Paenibacillus phyllosphaerae]MBB3108332.1 DNA-binding MarR family transcriptional regulator [Paenibacillus phyllosphaerae]
MKEEQLKSLISRYQDIFFTVNRRINAILKDQLPDGLTTDQYATLRYIRDHGPCTSSALADMFCVGKSSITAIITRLFDKHLIERVPDEKDRRVTYLKLTPAGLTTTAKMEDSIQNVLRGYLNQFDAAEAEAFMTTFEKLARVLSTENEV